jgi:transcriptional regulator with XRE-family HTH domain
MELAQKLKSLRDERGESLQEVADLVGVSKAHIWELETGKSSNPGLQVLRGLASHFEVSVAFLADEGIDQADAKALQFCRDFAEKLSDRDWNLLRRLASRLAEK